MRKFEAELKPLLAHATSDRSGAGPVPGHEIVVKTDNVCNPSDMMANFQRGELSSLRDFRTRLVALRERAIQNGVK
jgi:hypothetical protein